MRKFVAACLLVAYLALLFDLTLFRFLRPGSPMNLVPFRTIRHDLGVGGWELVVNGLGNLVAFAPMGVLPPILLGRRCSTAWRVAGLSFGLSLVIEISQGLSGSRVADVDDLTLNTLGGLIGHGARVAVRRRIGWRRSATEPGGGR